MKLKLVGSGDRIGLLVLILARVPRGELITTGPFASVKHPLYTGVSLGTVMYVAARWYALREEAVLTKTSERIGTPTAPR